MNIELISIIVPIYNTEKYLERCINSLINQSYDHIEIILVDDGSIDNSPNICGSFANDSRIRYFRKENGGLSSARNYGLQMAQGEFVSFIDSDDYIELEMIEDMYGAINRTDSQIAVCGRFDDYDSGESNVRFSGGIEQLLSSEDALQKILRCDGMDVSACDKLFRRCLFENIRFPEGQNVEDASTIPVVISHADRIVHVGKAFYHYCHRSESISLSYDEKLIKDLFKATNDITEIIKDHYPHLKRDLDYYWQKQNLLILKMSVLSNYVGYERQQATNWLKKNWKCKNCTFKENILYLSLITGTYVFLNKLKK